jgi:hypothetical protein
MHTYIANDQVTGAGVAEITEVEVAAWINDNLALNDLWGLARDNKDKFKPTEDFKDVSATWSEEKSEIKSQSQQGSFGFRYDYSFDKFHAGIELFKEGNYGKMTVKQCLRRMEQDLIMTARCLLLIRELP